MEGRIALPHERKDLTDWGILKIHIESLDKQCSTHTHTQILHTHTCTDTPKHTHTHTNYTKIYYNNFITKFKINPIIFLNTWKEQIG